MNTLTTIDISPIVADGFDIYFYTQNNSDLHKAFPLLWELALYETERENVISSGIGLPAPKLQFRSALTPDSIEEEPWYGANGEVNDFFSSPGEAIGRIHDKKPWFQYRVIAETNNEYETPVIGNISIGTNGAKARSPVAIISAPDYGIVGKEMSFLASGSYSKDASIVSYEWNFGDGFGSKEILALHNFSKA